MTAFLGTVLAAGFMLDVALIGESEARTRALAMWADGIRLLQLPDGGWLVVLGSPVTVRAEHAAGTPLLAIDGALVAPGNDPVADSVVLSRAGAPRAYRLADLPEVDCSSWVDISALTEHRLTPADGAPSPRPVVEVPAPPEPDLRAEAGVGTRSSTVDKLLRRRSMRPAVPAVRVVAGLLLFLVAARQGAAALTGLLALGVIAFIGVSRSAETQGAGSGGAPPRSRRWPLLAGWLLRTPIARLFRGGHERYLHKLTQRFHRGEWDDALREAIGLGGESGSLSLRVPRRRSGELRPSPWQAAGGSVLYGVDVQVHLRELYVRAAAKLESENRIEQAAFLLADLLNDAGAAVELLERHGRLRLAAEVAEGRKLAAELVVRLWWRAGERDRAIDIARTRTAFAAGVDLLSKVDAESAIRLRAEWALDRRACGDHLGAVEAAWPAPELRPSVVPDIQAGMALGGPTAARLFAHVLSQWPSERGTDSALALLDDDDPALGAARDAFALTLTGIEVVDPAVDRRLCDATLRSLVRHGTPDTWSKRMTTALTRRADPLLAADLVRPAARLSTSEVVRAEATPERGQLPVCDAVTLPGGAILLAHGHHGVRLLTLDGRVRARWTVPAHRLVVADHGTGALVVGEFGDVRELHHLDLATRTVRPWTTLRATLIAETYDGSFLLTADDDGIALLDVRACHPRAVRRLLEPGLHARALNRDQHRLAALVVGDHIEVRQWSLPDLILRARPRIAPEQIQGALLSSGTFAGVDGSAASGVMLAAPVDAETHLSVETRLRAVMTFPDGGSVGVRHHGDTATLWDTNGRVVAIDTTQPRVVARLSTRL